MLSLRAFDNHDVNKKYEFTFVFDKPDKTYWYVFVFNSILFCQVK